TDDTAKVLEAYASKDSRVRVVHNEKNIKLIATLNKGIQLAKGEYIARMDSDDISVLNRLEIQINKLIQSPEIDLLGSSMILIDQNSKKIKNIKVR
ncbi:glycosyltransferase, partial [Stenotrophomonas maltophilia]|nr:glycosyltransferase [Stenotrophomonas maltophilia]